MDILYILDRFLVYSHVAAGMIGLLAAPVAMATIKGGKTHRLWGKIFFWMMFWIMVSTFGLMFFRFNFFLLVIAVLSFYSALTGTVRYTSSAHKLEIRHSSLIGPAQPSPHSPALALPAGVWWACLVFSPKTSHPHSSSSAWCLAAVYLPTLCRISFATSAHPQTATGGGTST